MKQRLLDYIFSNLNTETLSRKEVIDYLRYLEEIITTDMKPDDQMNFLACKVKLNKRMITLDKQIMATLPPYGKQVPSTGKNLPN